MWPQFVMTAALTLYFAKQIGLSLSGKYTASTTILCVSDCLVMAGIVYTLHAGGFW